MNLPKLANTVKAQGTPGSYLPWGSKGDLPSGKKATKIAARFSGGHTTNWQFRSGKYDNLNSFAASGDEFRPDTVLILRVRVGDADYRDPAGNPVPETHFTGKGATMVFHDGTMVRGTWTENGLHHTVGLRTKKGSLRLPPGNVWIELVPAKGGSVQVSK